MKHLQYLLLSFFIYSCSNPKEISVLTKKSVNINEPVQIGLMVNFAPTKYKLKPNDNFKILDEPKVILSTPEIQMNMVRYIILPLKSGNLEIPKCIVYDSKDKYITENFTLEVSNNSLDSISSKIILENFLQFNADETDESEVKEIMLTNELDKNEYNLNDTIKLSYASSEFDFYTYRVINLGSYDIAKGPLFNYSSSITKDNIVKMNKVDYYLIAKEKGEYIIPAIDTMINNLKVSSDEIKLIIK